LSLAHGRRSGQGFLGWLRNLRCTLDAARAHGILSYLEESAAQGQGRVRYAAGGAALNAVRVASLLGARASFVGVVGEDLCGDVVRVGLKASGIEALLDTSGGREGTGIFVR